MASTSSSASDCSTNCPLNEVRSDREPSKRSWARGIDRLVIQGFFMVVTAAALLDLYSWRYGGFKFLESEWRQEKPAPLVMDGGDPYIRALMRTISASESNVSKPYSVIYGGEQFNSWNEHPDRCITIYAGPNTGNCSTAAGRYQFITTTWEDQARKYHPEQPNILFWRPYRFDPASQDIVVHDWLSDSREWGADLSGLLQAGEIHAVLEILSPTWTSLGYGIETNSMSGYLPEIYFEMLNEELENAGIIPTAIAPMDDPVGWDVELSETALEDVIANEQPLITQADGSKANRDEDGIRDRDEAERRRAVAGDEPFLMPPGELIRRISQELSDLL